MAKRAIRQKDLEAYEDLRITIDLTWNALDGHWSATSYAQWPGRRRKMLSIETGDGRIPEGFLERHTVPAAAHVARWLYVHNREQLSLFEPYAFPHELPPLEDGSAGN
jgi:hypothetical protein